MKRQAKRRNENASKMASGTKDAAEQQKGAASRCRASRDDASSSLIKKRLPSATCGAYMLPRVISRVHMR